MTGASWADRHPALIDEGIKYVRDHKTVSASQVQRRLRVGYASAGFLLEALEERGIVGPVNARGVRDVLAGAENDRGRA